MILFFLLLGGGAWGNNAQGNLTRSDMYEGFNAQNTFNDFRAIQSDINSGFAGVNANICNASANNMLALNNGFNGVQNSIAETRYSIADCCCQIKNAIRDDGEQTRALIQSNTIQDLRDRLQDSKTENLVTGLVAAQTLQTNNLENFIRGILSPCNC